MLLREAAKKSSSINGRNIIKRGVGVKGRAIKEKKTFFVIPAIKEKNFFFAASLTFLMFSLPNSLVVASIRKPPFSLTNVNAKQTMLLSSKYKIHKFKKTRI